MAHNVLMRDNNMVQRCLLMMADATNVRQDRYDEKGYARVRSTLWMVLSSRSCWCPRGGSGR